jgi:predicted GIY-YIG superfamily endonuclease
MSKPTKLYRHFDASGELLYVGISNNVLHRLKQHEVAAAWQEQITTITIERYPTRQAALDAEREAIWRENPRHNSLRYEACESASGEIVIHITRTKGRKTTKLLKMSKQDWDGFCANLDRAMRNAARMAAEAGEI